MKKVLAILATMVAASAFAGDLDYPPAQEFVSTKTRAEVKAELKEFVKHYECIATETKYPDDCHLRHKPLPESVFAKTPVDHFSMMYRGGN